MPVPRLSHALIAATLLSGAFGSVFRVQAATPSQLPAATVAGAPITPRAPDLQLSGLVPEISLSLRNDISTVSLADLDASGFYKPDRARSPSAFEQIRKRIGRASLTPNQLEALKQESPQAYEVFGQDGAIQDTASPMVMPNLSAYFRGEGSGDQIAVGEPVYIPPDPTGEIGPYHYVQAVNTTFGVFATAFGNRNLGPLKVNALFAGFGGPCETTNDGDPIVQYDQLSDRWLISQFALPNIDSNAGPFYQCIAISTTGDPMATWYRYQFLFDNTLLNDYTKFGVWPDAYYATVNLFEYPGSIFRGMAAIAYERDKMLAGLPARQIVFKLNN
ncbi:MAG TPA: hypothetical protein PLG23_00570 [Thermoflexales bacterium]|nr:hypothetical protein [Thermoflexales bacterium]